jgi:hypothetical protein
VSRIKIIGCFHSHQYYLSRKMAATRQVSRRPKEAGDGSTDSMSSSATGAGSSAAAQSNGLGSSSATQDNGPVPNKHNPTPTTTLEWFALVFLLFLTYILMPHPLHPENEPTAHHVFYYGWLTAISTGLGVVPLLLAPNLAPYWVGVCNGMYERMCNYARGL